MQVASGRCHLDRDTCANNAYKGGLGGEECVSCSRCLSDVDSALHYLDVQIEFSNLKGVSSLKLFAKMICFPDELPPSLPGTKQDKCCANLSHALYSCTIHDDENQRRRWFKPQLQTQERSLFCFSISTNSCFVRAKFRASEPEGMTTA